MKWNSNYKLFIFFLILQTKFMQISFIGNTNYGFSFSLLPNIKNDPFSQLIYVCSKETIPYNNNKNIFSFSLSVCDIKNNPTYFIPIITKNVILNGILEENPLYNKGIKNFDLFIGTTLEPKLYPIINPENSSIIYILNNLELYNNQSNQLISTDPLLDIDQNEGNIILLIGLQNQLISGVIEKNTIFGDIDSICKFYQYPIKETIINIPGNTNYKTKLEFGSSKIFIFNNKDLSLCNQNEDEVTLIKNNITLHGNQILNKAYIGVSGKGATGIKAVTLYDKPILPNTSESALNGNNIVITNSPNINLYIKKLSSLSTSTGLSYLVVLGGTYDEITSNSTVYALPLINYSNVDNNLIGTLASVTQTPQLLFDNKNPYYALGNKLTESPINKEDLFTHTSKEALVGGGPLIIEINGTTYQLKINSLEGYKDTIFAATSYMNNDENAMGGIFYSQGLFNEYGMIKVWTEWKRKNICGNCETQSYIPTIGSNIAIKNNLENQIIGNQFSSYGPFLGINNNNYKELDCLSSGIQKIIDIPYSHPGLGRDKNNLKPSYFIAVGFNTVILQQTAKHNSFLPILKNNVVNCINGNTQNIDEKTFSTNIITFQGGALENAGALFTAGLGYNDFDSWIIVGGANGIYILSDENGIGCGPLLLRDNFNGINNKLKWRKLGNFNAIKKIVTNKNFLYVLTNNTIYRIKLDATNISLEQNCQYNTILKNTDLPDSTEFSSFSDGLFSNHVCILATSIGLFTNQKNSSIQIGDTIPIEKINLPESLNVQPIALYPITIDGNADSWGYGENNDITANIYIMATSLSQHYSKIYRLVCYGNKNNSKNTIFLLQNYFIKNFPTYYYNPNIELLSITNDGAVTFCHGVYGNSILYRSYVGIINPFLQNGNLSLKNEYNFFELQSQTNSYFGYPTFISGIGIWLFSSEKGIQGLC